MLSTHLIDEVADLLERVVMIDHGRVVLDGAADDVRGSATTVSGAVGGRRRSSSPVAGSGVAAGSPSQASVVVAGALDDGDWARARRLHLDLEPLSLQQVMVHAAGRDDDRDRHQREEKRMTASLNAARYHLVQWFNYRLLPWMVLAFAFVVDIVILKLTPAGHNPNRWSAAWPRSSGPLRPRAA